MCYNFYPVYFHYEVVTNTAYFSALCELYHALMRVQKNLQADCFAFNGFSFSGDCLEVERLLPLVLRFVWRVEARHLYACLRVAPYPLLHYVAKQLPAYCGLLSWHVNSYNIRYYLFSYMQKYKKETKEDGQKRTCDLHRQQAQNKLLIKKDSGA